MFTNLEPRAANHANHIGRGEDVKLSADEQDTGGSLTLWVFRKAGKGRGPNENGKLAYGLTMVPFDELSVAPSGFNIRAKEDSTRSHSGDLGSLRCVCCPFFTHLGGGGREHCSPLVTGQRPLTKSPQLKPKSMLVVLFVSLLDTPSFPLMLSAVRLRLLSILAGWLLKHFAHAGHYYCDTDQVCRRERQPTTTTCTRIISHHDSLCALNTSCWIFLSPSSDPSLRLVQACLLPTIIPAICITVLLPFFMLILFTLRVG